jgi:P-type Cu2+ transporter
MSCCAGSLPAQMVAEKMLHKENELVQDLRRQSRLLTDGSVLYTVSVPSIHCGQCISAIEKRLGQVEGVKSARANLSLKRATVTLKDSAQSPLKFVQALEDSGFAVQTLDDDIHLRGDPEFKTLVRALAVAGFASANIMLLSVAVWSGAGHATTEVFHYLSSIIAIPTVAYSGRPFFRSAAFALKHRRVNMDVPISLGVILATAMSLYESFFGGGHAYFDAAVSLLFFLLIGRTLDHVMRSKARDAVGRLARLSAKGGLVVLADGSLTYLSIEGIRPGMIVRVVAGERVPVDGVVIDGVSDVDRALVTGESAPIIVTKGSSLEAGILNLTGAIDIKVMREAKDSFLADVLQMMQAAENGRGHYVRLADRVAGLYAPFVHVVALVSFLGWMVATSGSWHQAITVAISVLIITCPCALGLAVPVAHVIAASRLSSIGVLMKDGSALERLADIDSVAFDKTGTLTSNQASIGVNEIPSGKLSRIAKGLALRSIHPAAQALARSITEQPYGEIKTLHEIPGFGVEGDVDGRLARLGRQSWVYEIATKGQNQIAVEGLGFAWGRSPLYHVQLNEELRVGARETVQAFTDANISNIILSGDSELAVGKVAALVGIVSVKSGLRPGDKLTYLKAQADRGRKVLMVGDGLNDAPALAAAHVSMAPSSASDTGRMAADFVFTSDNLMSAYKAYNIACQAQRIVKQNFGLAIAYNLLAVPLAVAGALNPLIAAIAMSSSSILVVGNSMRLYLAGRAVEETSQLQSPVVLHKIWGKAV